MDGGGVDTDALLAKAEQGDGAATETLMNRHRERLRRMVSVRIDPRLAARVDPSDVIQEALTEAFRLLPDYLEKRPLPFYPWLRRLAWQRLVQLHRKHIHRQKRTTHREEPLEAYLSEGSTVQLAGQLMASDKGPRDQLIQQELLSRVQMALGQLHPADREILILRHLEELSVEEAAVVLEISRTAVTSRHFRAMQRIHSLLSENSGERASE